MFARANLRKPTCPPNGRRLSIRKTGPSCEPRRTACWTTCSTTSRTSASGPSGSRFRARCGRAFASSGCQRAGRGSGRGPCASSCAMCCPTRRATCIPASWAGCNGGGTPVGMLAEMLAAGLNANLGGRDHIPVEVERQVIRWVRRDLRVSREAPPDCSSPELRWRI